VTAQLLVAYSEVTGPTGGPDDLAEVTRVTLSKDPADYATVILVSTDEGSTWEGSVPFPGADVEPTTRVAWQLLVTAVNDEGVGASTLTYHSATI